MQREYEFRGQQFDDKQWIYGSLLEDDIIVTKGATSVDEDYIGFSDEWSSVLAETVGQYTGLKDKNGKKIYEGDIITFEDTGEDGYEYKEGFDFTNGAVVCFANGRFDLENFFVQDGGVQEESDSQEELVSLFGNCEVIGNIHENPELLGKEKEDGRSVKED